MNLDVDGGTLLYVLGIGFALAALAYFIRDVVFALSITIKAALLFIAFLAFLLGGVVMDRDVLDRVSLVLGGAAYVVFLAYVVTRYGLDATGIFLALAASAVLFIGLGYGVRQHRPDISARTGTILAVALVGLAVLLVGADVATAGVSYDTEVEESITVSVPADAPADQMVVPVETTIGTVTVNNDGPFTRPVSLPAVSGCLAGMDAGAQTDVYLDYRPRSYDRPDYIAGGETQSYTLVAQLPVPNETETLNVTVERGTDCEMSRDEPTLIVDVSETGGR